MKRTALAVMSLMVLFSAVVIRQLCSSAIANPGWTPFAYLFPDPPIITIYSPLENHSYTSTDVVLSFSVTKPAEWLDSGKIDLVAYFIDTNIYHFDTRKENVVEVQDPSDAENSIPSFIFSFDLKGLEDGSHTMEVFAEGYVNGTDTSISKVISFITYTPGKEPPEPLVDVTAPVISGLSIKNKTYSQNDLSLSCVVDESTSWKGCSLDGLANVTFMTSNYFSNIASGSHFLTVYANDTSGNMGASETVYFTIEVPPEPFPTTLVMASSIPVTVILVGLGLLLYRIKRK